MGNFLANFLPNILIMRVLHGVLHSALKNKYALRQLRKVLFSDVCDFIVFEKQAVKTLQLGKVLGPQI